MQQRPNHNNKGRDRMQQQRPNHNNKGIGIEGQLCQSFNSIGISIDSEDLLSEIFLRIPPISLVRFKYVSKSWYSLISNNLDFLLRHWKYWKRIDLLLLGPSSKPVDVIDSVLSIFRFNLPKSMITNKEDPYVYDLRFNNTCNGLLLYHTSKIVLDYHVSFNDNGTVFYVCNPTTKQYIKLPKIELKNVDERNEYKTLVHTKIACIVFDPSVSLSYKVIRCCLKQGSRNCNDHGSVLYVYSSETNSWRLLTRFRGHYNFGFRTALVNGVFYWYTNDIGDNCFRFDVEKENVWFLPLPTKTKKHRICLYFGECGGRLCLIERYQDFKPFDYFLTNSSMFYIKEMEEQQHENGMLYIWRVKYHVNMTNFHGLGRKFKSQFYIMHFYRSTTGKKRNDGEEEEDTLLMSIDGTKMVVSFNLTSDTSFGDKVIDIPNIENVIEIPNIKNGSKHQDVVPYTPTLFPVHR